MFIGSQETDCGLVAQRPVDAAAAMRRDHAPMRCAPLRHMRWKGWESSEKRLEVCWDLTKVLSAEDSVVVLGVRRERRNVDERVARIAKQAPNVAPRARQAFVFAHQPMPVVETKPDRLARRRRVVLRRRAASAHAFTNLGVDEIVID